jgi:hypothetical protein
MESAMTTLLPGFKKCKKCRKVKAVEDFHVDRSLSDDRKVRCRECTNKIKANWRAENQSKIKQQKKASYEKHRDKYLEYFRSDKRRMHVFNWKLKRQYGITLKQFERMMDEQNGCCAICGNPPSSVNGHKHKHRLCIDHCHETGVVRGLLCTMCNAAIGYFEDNLERVQKAVNYLTHHDNKTTFKT